MDIFTHLTALAALAVVVVQQILKLNVVPVAVANRHPVPTLFVLSIVAAVIVTWQSGTVAAHNWTDWILLVATISVVAGITYNVTLRNWTQLRSMEGEGK